MDGIDTGQLAQVQAENAKLRAEIAALRAEGAAGDGMRAKHARVLLDEMYQFVGLLDPAGMMLEANQTALDAAGLRREDVVGTPVWDTYWWTISPQTQQRLRDAVAAAVTGKFVRYEVEVLVGGANAEGRIAIDFSLKPVQDDTGAVIYLVAEGRNITEKLLAEAAAARANAELRTLYERLKDFDRLKTEFFSNVSHELRTPLTLVLGPLRTLLAAPDLAEDRRRDLAVAQRNAQILLKHVNDLLDVSRLEAGKMALRFVELDLAHLVRVTASHFDSVARDRSINFTVETPPELPTRVDPEKVQRILLNLLANAYKFTPARGTITCLLQALPDTDAAPGPMARISVQDSGPGVPPALRELIFERFRQAEGSATRRFGGTGLGLAIAKEFAELHGGTIMIEDAPGGGALFHLDLPLPPVDGTASREPWHAFEDDANLGLQVVAELATPDETHPAHIADSQRPLVLVVEDNHDMRRYIAGSLAPDYRVATAEDGWAGLEQALALRPDVILSDVMMPRLSGDQLVHEIRRHPDLDGVPIILLTARADDELRVNMLRGGAQDYLVKPFSVEELRARVGNLATTKRAREILRQELASQSEDLALLAEEAATRTHDLHDALTALQQTEASERRARQEAEAAVQLRDRFISVAAHELKTPMTSLLGFTQILRYLLEHEQVLDLERSRDPLRHIEQQTTRLNRLVNQILDLVYVEVGSLTLNRQPTEVGSLISRVVNNIQATTEAHTIVFRAETACIAKIDARRMEQIVTSLLDNAIRYSPSGGPIDVTLTLIDATTLRLSVEDHGIGVPIEYRAALFERFTQAHDSGHRSGLGIGLYLSRRLAELHGGRIEASFPADGGSVFSVFLPRE